MGNNATDIAKAKLNESTIAEFNRINENHTKDIVSMLQIAVEHAYDMGYKDGTGDSVMKTNNAYENGFNEGMENNCGAYTLGYVEGQKKLLDALRVIEENSHPITRQMILFHDPSQIIEHAKAYIDAEEKRNIERTETIVKCHNCKWNSGKPERPYCQLQSRPRNADYFCSDGEKR